ncbi:MAG: radical SAM protein, partial [Polyangiaceae bacterium]
RDRVVLQISVDSPSAELHDLHRGRGAWSKAMSGVRTARELGFRVRLAATVSTDAEEAAFREYLDQENVADDDRVIRRVALRGFAQGGVALAKADLVPEVTITDRGVYWHPVGADDQDFFVSDAPLPLAAAIDAVREHWGRERKYSDDLASIFHCA